MFLFWRDLKELILYCVYGVSVPSLHRESTDSLIEVAVSLAGQTIALPPNNRLAHETIEVCLLQRKQGLRIKNIIKKTK